MKGEAERQGGSETTERRVHKYDLSTYFANEYHSCPMWMVNGNEKIIISFNIIHRLKVEAEAPSHGATETYTATLCCSSILSDDGHNFFDDDDFVMFG